MVNTIVSYGVSNRTVEKMKMFTKGVFLSKNAYCLDIVLFSEKKALFEKFSLSPMTVTQWVEEMSADIRNELINVCSELKYVSNANNESTDYTTCCL